MELKTVTLRVPPDRVPDVVAFAAGLQRRASPAAVPAAAAGAESRERDAVCHAYLGGSSTTWRPFLRVLAAHAGQWVSWRELCRAIDRTPAQAAGMLGAAERRCRQYPPYEKSGWIAGERWFRMSPRAAAVVRSLGDQSQT